MKHYGKHKTLSDVISYINYSKYTCENKPIPFQRFKNDNGLGFFLVLSFWNDKMEQNKCIYMQLNLISKKFKNQPSAKFSYFIWPKFSSARLSYLYRQRFISLLPYKVLRWINYYGKSTSKWIYFLWLFTRPLLYLSPQEILIKDN